MWAARRRLGADGRRGHPSPAPWSPSASLVWRRRSATRMTAGNGVATSAPAMPESAPKLAAVDGGRAVARFWATGPVAPRLLDEREGLRRPDRERGVVSEGDRHRGRGLGEGAGIGH